MRFLIIDDDIEKRLRITLRILEKDPNAEILEAQNEREIFNFRHTFNEFHAIFLDHYIAYGFTGRDVYTSIRRNSKDIFIVASSKELKDQNYLFQDEHASITGYDKIKDEGISDELWGHLQENLNYREMGSEFSGDLN